MVTSVSDFRMLNFLLTSFQNSKYQYCTAPPFDAVVVARKLGKYVVRAMPEQARDSCSKRGIYGAIFHGWNGLGL